MTSFSIYTEGNSGLYRIDPRTKLFFLVCVVLIVMVSSNPLVNACLLIGCIVLAYLSVDYKKVARTLRIFAPFFVLELLVWPIFMRKGEVLFAWGILVITQGGLSYAFAMVLRILTMLIISLTILMTIKPIDLVTIMVKWRIPYQYSYATMITLTFLPECASAIRTVLDAQQVRGLDIRKLRFDKFVRNMALSLPPLLEMIFRKSEIMALSMDSLAFGAKPTRTFIRTEDLVIQRKDWVIMMVSLGLVVTYFIVRFVI
ncbi:MAG: energy-coupling factor transporter transmembrane protein EcfT [Thermoplasmata archaeon]|nr:energy-coupling factor transporter transmembrane protein EcfT [Thermoplasmata archaeon]